MVSCNVSCWAQLVSVFFEGCWILSDGYSQTVLLDGLKRQMSKACIDRSDSLIFQHKRRPGVTKYKKNIFWVHIRVLWSSFPFQCKAKHFIGQLWQLMTASNVGARTQAWQAKWAVFKIPGFVCKRFFPFFPTPSPLFSLRHFRAVFDYRSSFFAPKPHGNACYAGYKQLRDTFLSNIPWLRYTDQSCLSGLSDFLDGCHS